jgi:hypothetical protein
MNVMGINKKIMNKENVIKNEDGMGIRIGLRRI